MCVGVYMRGEKLKRQQIFIWIQNVYGVLILFIDVHFGTYASIDLWLFSVIQLYYVSIWLNWNTYLMWNMIRP